MFVLVLVAATASAARANTITNLYDTGVTNANTALVAANLYNAGASPSGVLDPYFATSFPGTAAYTFEVHPYHSESTLSDNARWISTAFNGDFATNTEVYDYTETFDLTGLIANSAVISGSWASDDCATIFVNGVSTGQTIGGGISACSVSSSNFTGLSTFLINSGDATFNQGSNTLDFRVYNAFSDTALLVTGLQANASAVPEPSSVPLTLTGCLFLGVAYGIGSIRRRRAGNRT
jgi:hypothetical protein